MMRVNWGVQYWSIRNRLFFSIFLFLRYFHVNAIKTGALREGCPSTPRITLILNPVPHTLETLNVLTRFLDSNQSQAVHILNVKWSASTVLTAFNILRSWRVVRFSNLLFIHPQALGGRGRGIFVEALLRLFLRKTVFVTVVWDMLGDPIISCKLLIRAFGPSMNLFLDASLKQARVIYGPRFSAICPASDLLVSSNDLSAPVRAWESKAHRVFVPGRLYPPRDAFLGNLRKELDCFSSQIVSKFFQSESEMLKYMEESRAVLVTNFLPDSVRDYTFGRLSTSAEIKTHMVGKNFAVLHSGSLLISQRTPALLEYLEEQKHFIGFSTATEAADCIRRVLTAPQNPSWQLIANAGHQRLRQILKDDNSWTKASLGMR